mmetsp:Transcript_125488/g.366561  ORF Transcript_125488/g.366561 Transcript_125488/m.366561 type:complete len:231 (-) Transcript_125488:66-758(-)
MYVVSAFLRSVTLIMPSGAFLAKALKDLAISSGVYSTCIFFVMQSQNSWKSIVPFPSVSISRAIDSSSIFLSFRPTVSSSCSSSSTEMPPDSSHSTRSGSMSSCSRARQSCLKRQKIWRNSSLSSGVMPCFLFSFFLGGSFSAYRSAFSNSLTLTSPPPSLSILVMRARNSWSVALMPNSTSPVRSSPPEIVPSPPASMLLKRSMVFILRLFSLSAIMRSKSSQSAMAFW